MCNNVEMMSNEALCRVIEVVYFGFRMNGMKGQRCRSTMQPDPGGSQMIRSSLIRPR